jgi:hypothetical protein
VRQHLARSARQGRTIHSARQIDIGEQNVDWRQGEMPERVAAVARGLHRKSLLGQIFGHPVGDQELVLDKQDADFLVLSGRWFHCLFFFLNPSAWLGRNALQAKVFKTIKILASFWYAPG